MATNLDLVRSIFAPLERGDFSASDWAHPEIEYVMADGPEPRVWSGRAGMAEAARWVLATFEKGSVAGEQYRELDGGRVLVLTRQSGRGKASGLEFGSGLEAKTAHLFQVREGAVTRIVFYFDRDRAFADLGLTPEGD